MGRRESPDRTGLPDLRATIPPPIAVAQPATLGRYKVLRPLGSGGFGTVYLSQDEELSRPVAIKVCRQGLETSPEEVERFLEEARRLARLRHPGIVTVHDVGMFEGGAFIVSAYLEGPDLARWMKTNRATWIESAQMVAAVAEALAHAHTRLIVHRDVKPSNIIITADRVPVLVDFGLALDDLAAGGAEKGLVSGTPWYMSPEQAAGTAHRVDGRTDLYSLGVVFYEMLTGRVPFRSRDLRELVRQVLDDEPQPPRQLVAEIPPELERVCLKALAKQQQDRYSTAADFADDLRRVLSSRGGPPDPQQMLETVTSGPRPISTRAEALTPPSSRRRAREAERRQVTLLVCGCDLFASETYLERLDAEDQSRVLRAFQQACEQPVSRFEGTVVQCNEQGLLACFGYPIAYENAARRAARTGLGILENMTILGEQLRREHALELRAWVGIHTGPAVVESAGNSISLVGEARNVAVRLEEVAAPGALICTDATRRLIENRFQCTGLGPQKLKGVAQAVELFRIEGISNRGGLLDAAPPAELTPLTGRDHEFSLLKGRWEQVREGASPVIVLTGEPGLGKSRLVHALKEHVEEQAAALTSTKPSASDRHGSTLSVIEWRCSPHFQNTSLYPASEFFERFLDFTSEEAPATRLEKLIHHLGEYGLARPNLAPLFAALLSLPMSDRFPALGLSPIREREETFRALEGWLGAFANRRPILFIVEDLHWADASTLEFLGSPISEGTGGPFLTLLTARPEFHPPWPAVASQTILALNRLTRDQAKEMIQKKAGSALPEALIDQVYQRAGGVPLFIEEFTKVLQAGGGAALSHEIPDTLQDLIMARVDRVEGDREIAQLAAVLGREFNHELLAAVAKLDPPTLIAEMRELVQAGIICQRGRPPNCLYIFKHALLQDALYNSLVKARRQQIHRRVSEVLEAEFGELLIETRPELLAHHFSEAGLPEKAIPYWLQAGLRSRERSAEVEAIGQLTRGLALIKGLAESPGRDARELELLGPLGTAYIAARGYAAPEVGPLFQRARELCERVGQPPQLFAMMLGIWEWHTVRADLRLCVDLAREGMEFATRRNDPGMLMEALFMAGETRLYRGEFAAARDCFATAVTRYDDRERTKHWAIHTGHNAGITQRSNLAVALWHLGYADQALQANEEMRQLAREIGHPFSLAYALHHTAWLCQYCRLGAEVQAAAEEEIAIATAQGFALWQATGTFFKGAGLLLQRERSEGLPLLFRGLAIFRASGAELTLPCQLCIVGEACLLTGRFQDARRALREGIVLAEKNDERCQEAELHRLLGEVALAESPELDPAAEGFFRQAIATARRQQSKAWELRATMSLARLWQRQGRPEAARGTLAPLYASFKEGLTTPDLVDARALLENLGANLA
jgi:class 3 adenylate cyclase/predicted ATPase/predicted Ser/Thr protein kinase